LKKDLTLRGKRLSFRHAKAKRQSRRKPRPNDKQTKQMSKPQENKELNETQAAIFTSADVKRAVDANVTLLEMKRGKDASCSSEQYGALLFMTACDLGLIDKAKLPGLMQVWDAFPKSPSAFRQTLEKTEAGATSAAASAIMDKLLKAKG